MYFLLIFIVMLQRNFFFEIRFSKQDQDLFDRWERAENARDVQKWVRKIYARMFPDFDRKLTIDHIDRDIFNNMRDNLRAVDAKTQNLNRRKFRNNTSGHQGVSKFGKRRTYWSARYKHEQKFFPFTDIGLIEACSYYRTQMLADGSICETCHPVEENKEEQKEEKKEKDDPNVLKKMFIYTIKFSPQDKDLFERWSRADDARNMPGIAARAVGKRIGLHSSKAKSIDHINRDCFDQTRDNLRLATYIEQNNNRKVPQTNSSGHMGVLYKQKKIRDLRFEYWVAYCGRTGGKREKTFPYTPEGLKEACKYYRQVLRRDKTICETCTEEESKVEEKVEAMSV